MSSSVDKSRDPRWAGSETSSAELILYEGEPDPILTEASKRIEFKGRGTHKGSTNTDEPVLVSLNTTKVMGVAAGAWSAVVKSGLDGDLRDRIVDDQWCDIVFKRWGRPYATMRGSVDRITRNRVASGKGATTTTYTLTGRDFGKIWDLTPIWFNQWAQENVVGASALRVVKALNTGGSVSETVSMFLFGFLRELEGRGRSNWLMPKNLPGGNIEGGFVHNVQYAYAGYTNDPVRFSISPNFMNPNGGTAWGLAQQWSDPAFCELWTDTIPVKYASDYADSLARDVDHEKTSNPDNPITLRDVSMAVVLRDRPFPTQKLGKDSPWFRLATNVVSENELVSDTLSRGGDERYNAFFVAPQVIQELLLSGQIDVTAPYWDSEDMLIHGMRRFDVNSNYIADIKALEAKAPEEREGALYTLSKSQREKMRDWYCMNPYLWSGTLELGHGRPDIRLGTRVKIPGATPKEDFHVYVEQVDHSWSLVPGIRTSLGVTRGWYGTDDAYLKALSTLAGRYTNGRNQNV